ncbi:MAG TPA: polysaccharide deacetylase family protein, partial [Candidatus Deferrimicrobiaceae bacterium]
MRHARGDLRRPAAGLRDLPGQGDGLSRGVLFRVTVCLLAAASSVLAAETPSGVRSLAQERRTAAAVASPVIAILCYHDISDRPDAPSITISPALLRAQIRSLKKGGWAVLSLSELLAFRGRPKEIPPRVAVLTFDDGYRSFSEKVLPILREEGVKATLAIVTSFIGNPPPGLPPLMSWDQIREADRSGMVEIVSHSHDLHRYVTSNPYRDTFPAVATRLYEVEEGRYEDRDEYWKRIREDLRKSRGILREKLGHEVHWLAWPYGKHTAVARNIAKEEGLIVTLGLDGVAATPGDLAGGYLPRVMVYRGSRIDGRSTDWLLHP